MKRQNRVAFFNILSVVLLNGISLITAPLFSRILGDSGYGILKIYNIWASVIAIVFTLQTESTLVNARVDVTITLARIFGLLFGYGARLLWGYLKIMNNRKKAAEAEKKRRKKIINTRYQ